MKNIENLRISSEYQMKPDAAVHFGKVIISAEGYFLFTGGEQLEIDTLIIDKDEDDKKYDFLVQTPDGEDGEDYENGHDAPASNEVKIIIHSLENTAHIKSVGGKGGKGGKGQKGAPGGKGGDAIENALCGGKGGNGGSGGKGMKGGKGSDCPTVEISYCPASKNIKILTLAMDNTIDKNNTSFGGSGGDGGKGGDGGDGGKGGKNSNGTNAEEGKQGKQGECGDTGDNGQDGFITINIITNGEDE